MLKKLSIANFAIIESCEIEFKKGFSVITGETGAGKSLIFDAIMLCFGEKANANIVRTGANKSIIELEIDIENNLAVNQFLDDENFDKFANTLILRREISSKGTNRTFLNDSPISINQINYLSQYIVDYHSQHRSTFLLDKTKHALEFDEIAGIIQNLKDYRTKYLYFRSKVKEYIELSDKIEKDRKDLDYKIFVLEEIAKVSPRANEDEELEKSLNMLENAELLHTISNETVNLALDGDYPAYQSIKQIIGNLEKLNEFSDGVAILIDELKSSLISLKETHSFLIDFVQNVEFNPQVAEYNKLRLAQINSLKRKYGTLEQIFELIEEYSQQIDTNKNSDMILESQYQNLVSLYNEVLTKAVDLSTSRNIAKSIFDTKLTNELHQLGMINAQIDTRITSRQSKQLDKANLNNLCLDQNGLDEIEFYIVTNKGEQSKPLNKIASGGELSRIMLALKNLNSNNNPNICYLFDEIDTGISGNIARTAGFKIKHLSEISQVIAISHLPQIASLADSHYYVYKSDDSGITKSFTKVLSSEERKNEVAKLLSGSVVFDEALANAEILLQAEDYK